ncbi:hypothetical protein LSCM1_07036 [Leishmania martiniquensis]|uniref:Uncharacterized protein n=1 Tax=Leishmania martiniquensis TaxID=1580590 RepID=A0A836HY27_9TRYP|nr:hypothetical protein LSCM1_07036 [Leishmania martiniquensis]
MSISSSVTYALLCVYYACRTTLLFMVEMLLFLPSYYLVERHDTPSVWLGRRGEAQVQPVLSSAYQYQKAEERDTSNNSDSVDMAKSGARAQSLDGSTRETEDSRGLLSRKAVGRIRSLRTAKESSSWWWPQVPRAVSPFFATRLPDTPHSRQQRQRGGLSPSSYGRPPASGLKGWHDEDGRDAEDMNGSQGSWSNYTVDATPIGSTVLRPLSLHTVDVAVWRDGSPGGEPAPISLQSSPMQRTQRFLVPRALHQRPSGGGFDEEDAVYASFNEPLSATVSDAADGGDQQPCVTDTFFDGVAVSVSVSLPPQREPQQGSLAAARQNAGIIAEAEGLLARWGGRQCGVASQRATARAASAQALTAAARERLCTTVPMWCTVVFRSPAPPSDTIKCVESASTSFRGQYGFLPPWYAVHARAQLLLALADPLLRIAAELLCCRGWRTLAALSTPLGEELNDLASIATGSATTASPEEEVRHQRTRAPLPEGWSERESWQDVAAFLLRPLLMCARLLCSLVYTIVRPHSAMAPLHCWTCTAAPPTSHGTAVDGGGWCPFRRLEGAMQACIDRYTTDTYHTFEPVHADTTAATATAPSMPVITRAKGSISLSAHGPSQPTTARPKVAAMARAQAHMAGLPIPISSTSAPEPVCQQSVGVYWLHGRRPPMWSAPPAADLRNMSISQPPFPAPVVVLLLCPSLLQGNGLYPHTVMRLSHMCQLLTLAGTWQTSFFTGEAAAPLDDARADQALLSSRRAATLSRTTQHGDGSMEREEALPTFKAGVEEMAYTPAMHSTTSRSRASEESSEAEVNDTPMPQGTSSSPISAARPATRPAAQWYAAVPVVELRVPAASPERADDISMPSLTLRDLRHVVKRLRENLEVCQPPGTEESGPFTSTTAVYSAPPDSYSRPPSEGAAATAPAAPRSRRPVYIVGVGWSEASSPLLELAITQQQTPTGKGSRPDGESEEGTGARPPARLDGVVCFSHTLSSAFQLLPEQHAEALALKRKERSTSSLAKVARRASHISNNSSGSGNDLSAIAASISAASPASVTLPAAPHMPRILSQLTTGPARLLCLLTRMQLIADALLAHRQHQEQSQGGVALAGSGRILRTAKVCQGAMDTPARPDYKARKCASAPPSQVGSTALPCISFYQILHLFREAREEVNQAQRGLDRATITWTHQQQQRLQARLAQRSAALDCLSPASTGSLCGVLPKVTDSDFSLGMPRDTTTAPHSQPACRQAPLIPSSFSFSGAAFMPSTRAKALPQHGLSATPLFRYVRAASSPESFVALGNAAAAAVPTVPSMRVGDRRDAEREANVLTTRTFSAVGGGARVPFSSPDQDASPSSVRHDFLREPSTLSWLPHLETVTDWEELAKSPIMAGVQQQRLEAACKTADDLPPPPSVDPPAPLGGGRMQATPASASLPVVSGARGGSRRHLLSAPGTEAETGRYGASGSLSASPSFPAGNTRRCTWSQMSTDDVIASCTLQVVSPTVRQAARLPGSGASGVAQAAVALRGTPSANNRGQAAPTLERERLASEEFNSFFATPASSPLLFVPAPDGGASSVCVVGAERERGNAALASATSTSTEAGLHAPEKSAISSVPMPPPQLQQPIPYPPPSRTPALSSQAAALVELRVRSAQHAALIQRIRVPTLLVHSRDDPVAPTSTVPFPLLQANPWITTVLTRRGSHAVFMESVSEVWRRPRLVVTEWMRPAGMKVPSSDSAVAENKIHLSGSGGVSGAREAFHDRPLLAPLRLTKEKAPPPQPVPSAVATIPRSPALIAAASVPNPSLPPQTKAAFVLRDGNSRSSTSISNSCSTDDFNDDDDSEAGVLVELIPVRDAAADFKRQRSKPQCTASFRHAQQQQQHQRAAAAATSRWQVRIDGTTWLERLLFEYVEKVILCQPATSYPVR